MEDLDDFFAKKDKKKKLKTKDKKEEKKIKIKKLVDSSAILEVDDKGETIIEEHPVHDEGQWADFQEEKETDYSGLKIQNLEIAENENGGAGADSQNEDDGENGSGQKGPWINKQAAAKPEPERQEVETPVEVPVAAALPSSGYIPPHLRSAATTKVVPGARAGGGGRGRRGAPDLKNEENFPSLAAGMSGEVSVQKLEWAKKGFESVKSGASRSAGQNSEAPKITMGNRFDALSS